MTEIRSPLLHVLTKRGYIHQCTDQTALDQLALAGPITAYIGFDCTADSLHVGSLIPIMMLRRLQQAGHRPIVLLGNGTTRIGDPSGKDESRQLLSNDDIAKNMAGIRRVFDKYLTFGDGPTDAIFANNAEWLEKLNYIEFLRDYGRHFTINRMLTFDSVRLRLDREQPLTFLEFNYMLLQAYDFLQLGQRFNCRLQMGGSDQWGNIVNGVDLNRRIDSREVYGLTTPLLTTASGAKMGKTAAGAVWLDQSKLPVYDFWQFWRNTEDADVPRFLRLFTDLPLDEIARLEALGGAEINEAKKLLANEVTALCHGRHAAEASAETARRVFEEGGTGEALPVIDLENGILDAGISVVELLVLAVLAASNGEARRLIKGGGAKLNDQTITNEQASVTRADINPNGVIKLSAGKKRHALIKPT